MPRIGIPKELKYEQIVEDCFNRVEFRTAVVSGSEVNETEFKMQLGLFLEELEAEIQETWNEKKLSFTRR